MPAIETFPLTSKDDVVITPTVMFGVPVRPCATVAIPAVVAYPAVIALVASPEKAPSKVVAVTIPEEFILRSPHRTSSSVRRTHRL